MKSLWLAMSITMMSEPNSDGTPQIQVVSHKHYQNESECDEWRKDRYSHPWGSIDPVSGKAVLGYFFECTLQILNKEDLSKD